jgi:hypothetical protein
MAPLFADDSAPVPAQPLWKPRPKETVVRERYNRREGEAPGDLAVPTRTLANLPEHRQPPITTDNSINATIPNIY